MTTEDSWTTWEEWLINNTPSKPELKYNTNHKRTKSVEKKIISYLRRNKSFILHTVSVEDNKTGQQWFVDGGGWASLIDAEGELLLGHIKNLLQFLGGSQPLWYDLDRPLKRSYVRRNVNRGRFA